ncbi:MAG: bifunctional hydroxymethylpyrimidine kinase/phosphomethylpyrimidine kinase [Candidatus Gastranaerophilales bacterium]|nr:bifunctional hydroxymethylpyrimidine kinase/phosphomethylpyrimidine kinase [Candidatus Gastranaerophilales bacterium]
MEKKDLIKYIDCLKTQRILIIGDFALDEMIFGNTERISREAPVLILEHYETKKILGAASNAANNTSKLSGSASALGVYGDDYYGSELIDILNKNNIDTTYMVKDETRKTTTKTRISGSCNQSITQQIVRIDRQTKTPLSPKTESLVIENIKKAVKNFDGIILSDYGIGCLTQNVVNTAISEAKKHNKIIVADIQKDMRKYKGVTAITPNQPDSERQVGFFIKNEEDLIRAGEQLIKDLDVQNVLLTRGENGMALFEKHENSVNYEKVHAFNKKQVFDVTGAGDTVVAAYTLALCANLEPKIAMYIGNLAASIVIRYFGCYCPSLDELKQEII